MAWIYPNIGKVKPLNPKYPSEFMYEIPILKTAGLVVIRSKFKEYNPPWPKSSN
ncbi:MAG: hypothetical protein JJ892_04305 [Balneola sp.]|nr:hypothetical protein [Balneola sp.]MBO6799481.1 hypothetical protein [Balneola sp.]MBO6870213.1 hypothetical protein [Balneola sp.]